MEILNGSGTSRQAESEDSSITVRSGLSRSVPRDHDVLERPDFEAARRRGAELDACALGRRSGLADRLRLSLNPSAPCRRRRVLLGPADDSEKAMDESSTQPDPSAIWDDVWRRWSRARVDRRAAFRHPVVATRCPERGTRARTVVLRAVDRDAGTLTLFTDLRSKKVAGISLENCVSWCFYDPRSRIQVRAETRATLHRGDETAREAWARLAPRARAEYAGPPPGAAIDGLDEEPEAKDAFARFVVVHCRLEEVDWLRLGRAGHQRLRFERDAEDHWIGRPVAP